MPSFDIVRTCSPSSSFRVAKVKADFDVKPEHAAEHFAGSIEYPDKWSIGAIVGASGTGKSTIAREVFGDNLVTGFHYSSPSVIDDMPQADVDTIIKTFYSVGFGSVPSWLKPYSVLSNGEKMRVDLARALLEREFIVFDEFTSVVDRQVAQTASLAVSKAVRASGKQFVAVSCHYDILDWLQPDWVFDTNEMRSFFGTARNRRNHFQSGGAGMRNGQSLGAITI